MTNTETAALARIRQMADAWEQQLPEVIRTPAVVSALRAVLDAAAPAVVEPPADQSALRDRIRRVLCERDGQGALWGTDMLEPDEYGADADAVLAVLPSAADWDALVREADNQLTAAEADLAAVETALGDTLVPAAREEALAGIAAVLPEPTDRAAVLAALSDREKGMLAFALEMAQEEIYARSLDFTDDDKAALDSLRRMAADCPECGITGACNRGPCPLRRMADETATETPADTLPAWLYQRFMPDGIGWDQLDEDDRSYWEHQARAVRRAVARGGFKQPAAGARQDGATP